VTTMAEAEELLAEYVPLQRKITGRQVTLERMRPLMSAFGNPHEQLKIIHVAGTSGKTSTAYFMARMLQLSGLRVGLTVSPHVDSVTERVQIGLRPLTEGAFVDALNEYMKILGETSLKPTYFELIVSFAYWYFV